ncbi:amidase [Priestia aryabhattai]|uniref:amidase n=1 Tax=Priestia aryabhattai TaxID=412384 RepID=UPI00203F7809|nr:amidase [Priestia aryabhattai]MCM3773393.1 amidase [Priestia aryabhattai]
MKSKCVLIFLVVVWLFNMGKGIGCESKVNAEMNIPLSTWVWDTKKWMLHQEAILEKLQEKKVTKVYLQIDTHFSFFVYKHFIEQAQVQGISVYALDGAPYWIGTSGIEKQDAFFNWIKAYQAEAEELQQFSGVHLDVEPYLYKSWGNNRAKSILQYQYVISQAVVQSRQLDLPLAVDIPFWFDEVPFKNSNGSGSLGRWVIQYADEVTIMGYRNHAGKENGIAEITENERKWGRVLSTPIEIGVETMSSDEGEYISFSAKGEEMMMQELDILLTECQAKNPPSSIAVHRFDSWLQMKP